MSHAIHTLQEYMLHTKTQTYLLATVFMIGLIFFWYFLTGKEDKE